MYSNLTAMGLPENYHKFQLWHGIIIAIVGILAISCFFSGIIVFMRWRRRESVRYVHQTKPMTRKNGEQGSVFSVRSQGILELQSPHPIALEEGNLSIGRSREQLQTDQQPIHARETSVNADPGYQQVDAIAGGGDVVYDEVGNVTAGVADFNRQSVDRQSVRSDSGRNIHFARQSASRGSVRSESGISTRVHHHGGDRGERFGSHKPTSMRTRSMVGTQVNTTDPLISFLTTAESRNDDGLDNSSTSTLPQVSIHQVHSPRQEASTPASKLSTSNLSDGIPGFCDPEILGGDNDSLEQLRIDLPPDIYSSQILSTVKSPEWEYIGDEDNEKGATAFRIITETSKCTQSMPAGGTDCPDDRIMLVVSGDGHSTLQGAEGPAEGFYDLPMLNRDNLETLFDDPGYKRGFAGCTWSATTSNARVYHTLEPPDTSSAPREAVRYENITIGQQSDTDTRSPAMEGTRWKQVMGYGKVALGQQMAGKEEADNFNGRTRTLTMEASRAAGKKDAVRYENVFLGEHDASKGEVEGGVGADILGAASKPETEGSAGKGEIEGRVGVASTGEMEGSAGVSSKGEVKRGVAGMGEVERGVAGMGEVERDVASKGRMKGSVESLALLDFEDSELMELDPDIAACLALESERGAVQTRIVGYNY